MSEAKPAVLCEAVATSMVGVRNALSFRVDSSELVDRFWSLQDTLGRLLDRASDAPQDVFETLGNYPKLIPDIVNLLGAVSRRRSICAAAVAQSCAAINKALLALEYLKQRWSEDPADFAVFDNARNGQSGSKAVG